jgi:hypothetical protein
MAPILFNYDMLLSETRIKYIYLIYHPRGLLANSDFVQVKKPVTHISVPVQSVKRSNHDALNPEGPPAYLPADSPATAPHTVHTVIM